MNVGERIRVRAYKADGTCYRRWYATVESVAEGRLVIVTPVGHRVQGLNRTWRSRQAIRGFNWADRWYNLLEVYAPDGAFEQIHINIASPARITEGGLSFTDYELDVTLSPPQEPRIVDEDEFREAAIRYGYSQPFQEACYRVAREAMGIAKRWIPRGMPAVEEERGARG